MQADVNAYLQLGHITFIGDNIRSAAHTLSNTGDSITNEGHALSTALPGDAGGFGQFGPTLRHFAELCRESLAGYGASLNTTSRSLIAFSEAVENTDCSAIRSRH